MGLDNLKAADFQQLVGVDFPIQFEQSVLLDARLLSVQEFNNYSPIDRQPFALEFRTSQKNAYYPQGIYTIKHPEKGDLHIFLVPIGFDAEGMKYEAVFS